MQRFLADFGSGRRDQHKPPTLEQSTRILGNGENSAVKYLGLLLAGLRLLGCTCYTKDAEGLSVSSGARPA